MRRSRRSGRAPGDVVLLRAEHKEEEHDEDDGKADKKRGVDDLLHSEDDDLCF